MEHTIELYPCPMCECFSEHIWCEDCICSSFTNRLPSLNWLDYDVGGESG